MTGSLPPDHDGERIAEANPPIPAQSVVDESPLDETTPDEPLPIVEVTEKLSVRERAMLTFERKWWRHAGSKEQAIREQFELSATRYYQLLNRLLDSPEAMEFDPVTVKRLRRLRATRARVGHPRPAES